MSGFPAKPMPGEPVSGFVNPTPDAEAAAAPEPGPVPLDGPHVDAYNAAVNDLFGELRASANAVDARDPTARADAAAAWMRQYGGRIELRARPSIPLTCYAGLSPAPPDWFMAGCRSNLDPQYNFPVAAPGSQTPHSFDGHLRSAESENFKLVDQSWLEQARSAMRTVEQTAPRYDWSADAIVRSDLLKLDQGHSQALATLLAKARGAVPAQRWLEGATELLNGADGGLQREAALLAVTQWLDLLPIPEKNIPSIRTHELAVLLKSYAAHAWQATSTPSQ